MDQNEASQSEAKLTVSNGEKHLVIKKYANRKFYDTEQSQYVTLGQIKGLVASGRSVIVIENVSKRDITDQTLATALVENISETKALSLNEIVDLIRKSTQGVK